MPPVERWNDADEADPVPSAPVPAVSQPDVTPPTVATAAGAPAPAKQRSAPRSAKAKQPRATSMAVSLVVTVGVAGAICAAAIGAYKLSNVARTYLMQQGHYDIAVRDFEITPLPIWIKSDLLAEVQRLAGMADKLNTLDEKLSQDVQRAFAMHPWVKEVVEVRVIRPSRVQVKLEYREPVAVVHTTRLLKAVDREGVLLPHTLDPDTQVYLTITGIRSTPSGPAGTKWDDAALAAGISVADALSPHHRHLGIGTIDVSSFRPGNSNPGSIFLLTEHGTRVKWGRPPSTNYPGEVPAQDKIDRLNKYASEHSSLDAPAGPYEMDITHWQEITLRPRAQSPTKLR
jgi:hypothetical protein